MNLYKQALLAVIYVAGFICANLVNAQDDPPPEDKRPYRDKIITLVIENDAIGTQGTDANYTSGVRLSYLDIDAHIPEFAHMLGSIIPPLKVNNTTSVSYAVGQNLYTPDNIRQAAPDPTDRPWAAHLYGSVGVSTTANGRTDELDVSLGVIGPLALGKETQTLIHQSISAGSPTPRGWGNQLRNEPALVIGWQQRFNELLKFKTKGLSFATSPHYGATVGNVHTFANAGVSFSVTPQKQKWQDNPIRVKPSVSGTGYFETPHHSWDWFLFSGLDVRAIARNIFLDGNTFRKSASIDKKHFVADANVGVSFIKGKYRFSYTLIYRTKEFDGQDNTAVFGGLNVSYRF